MRIGRPTNLRSDETEPANLSLSAHNPPSDAQIFSFGDSETVSGFIGRIAALMAACSAVLHGAALDTSVPVWVVVVTVAMLVGCLYCAYELWTRDTLRAWVLVAVMNLAMVAGHLPMTGSHQHPGGGSAFGSGAPSAMHTAAVVAMAEVLLATTVLLVRTRALSVVALGGSEYPATGGGPGVR